MNLRRLVSFILLVFSFLMVFQYGCGKKGDPVPSSGGRVETVSDLTAYLKNDRIELCWSIDEPQLEGINFKIFRAANETSGCSNCPPKYEMLAEIDAKSAKTEQGTFRYEDRDLKRGLVYQYYVIVVKDSKCSDASNTVEVKLE